MQGEVQKAVLSSRAFARRTPLRVFRCASAHAAANHRACIAAAVAAAWTLISTQRTETCAKVVHDRPRLLPSGKVAAFRVPLIVDQLGVGLFGPTPRGRTYFIREHTHDRGDDDAFRCKEGELVLPIEARRRNTRVRQPVERDVVENVVPRKALGLTVEDTCDQLIAPNVVVEDPGREADRGIPNTVLALIALIIDMGHFR